MKQTILVTGGAGYIGSFAVKELLDNNYAVVVFDSLENGHKEAVDPRAVLHVGNLADRDKTAELFNKYKIDAVIDFAAYLAVGESMIDPKKYIENNVQNFVKLLDVMVEKGCKWMIKSSTSSTYGDPEDKYFPLKENYHDQVTLDSSALLAGKWDSKDTIGEEFFQSIVAYYHEIFSNRPELTLSSQEISKLRIPSSVYGLTKLIDEIIMAKYNEKSELAYIPLRYFNVCGASFDGKAGEDKPNPTTLMSLIIYSILGKSSPLKIFGDDYPTKDGTGIRDYIHPLDLATGHVKALDYLFTSKKSDIFNLGCGKGYSVFEVMAAVEKASGKKAKYEIVGRRSGDPAVSYADSTKAEKLLKWKAKYDLDDMAKSAWKWHSQHPKGYQNK